MEIPNHHPKTIHLPQGVEALPHAENYESDCPLCHQQTVLRQITLSKAFLRPLYAMRQHKEGMTPKQISELLGRTAYANYTNLKYWGFIEPVSIVQGEKVVNGWCITEIGDGFVQGLLRAPEYLWVYNDRARIVPDNMLARYASFEELTGYKEMSREIAAAESVPLSVNGQEEIGV